MYPVVYALFIFRPWTSCHYTRECRTCQISINGVTTGTQLLEKLLTVNLSLYRIMKKKKNESDYETPASFDL